MIDGSYLRRFQDIKQNIDEKDLKERMSTAEKQYSQSYDTQASIETLDAVLKLMAGDKLDAVIKSFQRVEVDYRSKYGEKRDF